MRGKETTFGVYLALFGETTHLERLIYQVVRTPSSKTARGKPQLRAP